MSDPYGPTIVRLVTEILANQARILTSLSQLETSMATVQADIQALTAVVTTLQGQIATVITDLANINTDNLVPADQTALETAISNLQTMSGNLTTALTPPAPPSS